MTDSGRGKAEDNSNSAARGRFNRRNFLAATGTSGLALVAGCTGGGDGGDGGDGGGGGGGGGDGGDGGGGGDGGDGGGGTTGEPNIDGPIKVGALAPLPGNFAGGTAMQQAAELAVQQVNADGGVLGADVEVVVKDTALDPATARKVYRELMLEEEVDATIGLFGSEPGLAVFDEMPQFGKVHVAGGVSTTEINDRINDNYEDNKTWFRAMPNSYYFGLNLGMHAQDKFEEWGFQKIGLAIENITGFQEIWQTAVDNLPDSVEVAFTEQFSSDTNDFSPILDKGESEDIDLMYSFLSQGGIGLELQWAKRKPNYSLGGADIFSAIPTQWENTDGAVEYVWSYIPGSGPGFEINETTEAFIQAHRDEYGGPPPHSQAYTMYDAAQSLFNGIEAAGSLDTDDLVVAIEDDLDFEGVTGQINYQDKGEEYVHDPHYGPEGVQPPVMQWQEVDGEPRQVGLWPDRVDHGDYVSPPWIDN
ncbi:ABC transporter substrate-binding protein [Halorarius litoreus]|uniref:ABC transporter substrate-binding protein n=1 Tax=Halorarius litoreus TaxID=2962676 RepID=UPI0020CB9987|nr:ABC transporter substrate-binding protein [Halorarius litoreus]